MINHHIRKKNIINSINSKSQIPIKFKLNYSSLEAKPSEYLLRDKDIEKYDFNPIELSVVEKSNLSILRLKRNISIMVDEIKT